MYKYCKTFRSSAFAVFSLLPLFAFVTGCSDDSSSSLGVAANAGAAGSGGSGGVAGTSGQAGTAGSAGNAGAAGASGTAGVSGTGGASGGGGTAGNAGTAGNSGSAGSAGSSGTAGAGGAAASGGSSGSSGAGGTGGTALPPGAWLPSWQISAGDENVQRVAHVSIDKGANAHVALAAAYRGSINLGGETFSDVGTQGPAFVIGRLDGAGSHMFSRRLVNTSDMGVTSVVAAPNDSLLVTGWFTGSIDLGAGPVSTTLYQDSFVALYAVDGQLLWSKILGDSTVAGSSVYAAGAVVSQGEIVVVGNATGRVNLGVSVDIPGGAPALFAGRFSTSGDAVVSGQSIFPDARGLPYAVSSRPGGGIVIAGQFLGSFGIGGQTYTTQPPSNVQDFVDGYVVALDSSLGVSWSHDFRYSGASTQPTSIAQGADGKTWIVGSTSRPTADSYDIDAFVAAFDAMGLPVWNRNFGDLTSSQQANGVVTESDGSAVIVGEFEQALLVPGGSVLVSSGSTDGFLIRVSPTYQVSNVLAIGDMSSQTITCVDKHPDGTLVIGGGFSGVLSGVPNLTAGANEDVFVARGEFAN